MNEKVKKILKWLGLSLAAAIAGIVIAPLFLPKSISVDVEATVDAPVAEVFNYVGDLNNWEEWTTWDDQIDEMETSLSSKTTGEGAFLTWHNGVSGHSDDDNNETQATDSEDPQQTEDSGDEHWSGKMTIVDWKRNEALAFELLFVPDPDSESYEWRSDIQFASVSENSTLVRWKMQSNEFPYFFRLFAIAMQQGIKETYRESLANLSNIL